MTRDKLLIIIYVSVAALLFAFLPLSFAVNWYHFFDPIRVGFLPYVDFQVGYPVMGFVPYGALALLSTSEQIYGYAMRYFNLILLVAAFLTIYEVVRKYRGQRDALFTMLVTTLSLSILIAGPYANDVIALLFSSFALLFMSKKRAALCGLFTAFAIFAKIYPLLFLPIFVAYFDNWRERLRLLGSFAISAVLVNLPFLIMNPFMWSETLLGGNAGRGPWETIWAFLSGYYSHGGVEQLHPYFEGFFPYAELKHIYAPTTFDHAYYLYTNGAIPLVMNFLLLLSFVLPLVFFTKRRILELIGLSSSLFFLSSKGYSPEFIIFTLPMFALSIPGRKKFIIVPLLDLATILQMMNWSGWFAPLGEGAFLAYAVALRTSVLVIASIVCFHYATTGLKLREIAIGHLLSLRKDLARFVEVLFKEKQVAKRVAVILTLILVFSLLFYTTYGGYTNKLVRYDRKLEINTDEMRTIAISHGLKERMYIIIPSRLQLVTSADDCYVEEVNVENDTRLFLIPNHGDSTDVKVRLLYPLTNFSISEVLTDDKAQNIKGHVEFNQQNSSLMIGVNNLDEQGKYFLYLSWSVHFAIDNSTEISIVLTKVDGILDSAVLDVADGKQVFTSYKLEPEDFEDGTAWQVVVNGSSLDRFRKPFADFFGRSVGNLNLVLSLNASSLATIKLDELSYSINDSETQLPLSIQDSISATSQVYVGEFFVLRDPLAGVATWVALVVALFYFLQSVERVSLANPDYK